MKHSLMFALILVAASTLACNQSPVQLQLPIEIKTAPTPTPTCNTKAVNDFISTSDKTLTEFQDAFQLANQTPRPLSPLKLRAYKKYTETTIRLSTVLRERYQ